MDFHPGYLLHVGCQERPEPGCLSLDGRSPVLRGSSAAHSPSELRPKPGSPPGASAWQTSIRRRPRQGCRSMGHRQALGRGMVLSRARIKTSGPAPMQMTGMAMDATARQRYQYHSDVCVLRCRSCRCYGTSWQMLRLAVAGLMKWLRQRIVSLTTDS